VRLRRTAAALALVVPSVALGTVTAPAATAADDRQVVCRVDDDRLVEISGITWSRRHPGTYWMLNDSGGGPYLYAVDGATCRTQARIRIAGIGARDLEALATGVDPDGRPVLWVGDIGDNLDSWPSVRLHAVREPARLVDQEVGSTTYEFTFPDGGTNAESILADPERARVWVVTKGLASGDVWRVPLSTGRVTTAVRVGDAGGLTTDAAMSPDGTRFVIRDYLRAQLYAAPVSAAALENPTRISLPLQQLGEAVTFTADGTALLVASERERELWRVALPAPATPEPSASPSSTASPGATAEPSPPATEAPAAGGGTSPWKLGLAGLAVAAAVGVGIVAARRLRT
jgi:hypothetical protein